MSTAVSHTSVTLLCAHVYRCAAGRSFGSAAHQQQQQQQQQQPTAAAMLAGAAGGGEDPFLQNVLDTVHKATASRTVALANSTASTTTAAATSAASGASGTASATATAAAAVNQDVYGESWEQYRAHVAATSATGASPVRNGKSHKHHHHHHHKGHNNSSSSEQQHAVVAMGTVLDAEHPSFERQDKAVYGAGGGSRIYPAPDAFPEAREYMAWRLKRNRRRLQRLDRAATKIQVGSASLLCVSLVCISLCLLVVSVVRVVSEHSSCSSSGSSTDGPQ
jgi:hypothetical protein